MPRRVSSSWSMMVNALVLGAPDKVPAGNAAMKASTAVMPGANCPVTIETRCMMWLYRSIWRKSSTSTVPGIHTFPRSLRPRSTSMRCSEFSFESAANSRSSCRSAFLVAPRGRDPAMGCVVTTLLSTAISDSGDDPTMVNSTDEKSSDGIFIRYM